MANMRMIAFLILGVASIAAAYPYGHGEDRNHAYGSHDGTGGYVKGHGHQEGNGQEHAQQQGHGHQEENVLCGQGQPGGFGGSHGGYNGPHDGPCGGCHDESHGGHGGHQGSHHGGYKEHGY